MTYILSSLILTSAILFSNISLAQTYTGASFNEVWNVVTKQDHASKDASIMQEMDSYKNGRLPQYPANSMSIFSKDKTGLERDAKRTINERFDYYDRIPKKLHPNGVCVAGEWSVTEKTPYTGALATNFKGLFIGRFSTSMENTVQGQDRGFGIAGKVFPTLNPDTVVITGNLFTVDVLMGTRLPHLLDAKTTNKPEIGFNFSLLALMMKVSSALMKADKDPTFRPLTQVAQLGLSETAPIIQPKFIRLSAEDSTIRNNEKDFRTEVLRAIQENGTISYNIDVNDKTSDRNATQDWHRLGTITLHEAVTSYGCDRQLHFAHPKIR